MRMEALEIPLRFDQGGFDLSAASMKRQLVKFGADAAALGVISGVGATYVAFLKSTITPAAEAETAHVRLAAALRATGRDSEISAPQLEALAESMMKMSTFDDESIKGAFQALAQFPSIPTSAFEDLTLAAMDLSAATGGDLATNIEGIGRALETGLIPRSWGFSAALKEQFRAQIDAGDSAGALALMMDQLRLRYSGQATAEVTTYAGQVKQLDNNWGEFKEAIGSDIIPALSGLLGWINRNFEALTWLAGALGALIAPALAVSNLMKDIAQGNAGGIQNYNGGSLYVPPGAGGAPSGGNYYGGGGTQFGAGFYASGGNPSGLSWVGERGPELVNLPGGSHVYSNEESRAMQPAIDYYKLASILAAEVAKVAA